MVRQLPRELISKVAVAETYSGVLQVDPPIPPNPLVEPQQDLSFFAQLVEDAEALANFPGGGPLMPYPSGCAFGQLFYALAPVAEPPLPLPNRFHTIALFAETAVLGVFVELCYDTNEERLPLVGCFHTSLFSPAGEVFAFPRRWVVSIFCENDNPGVTLFQPWSVTWRESRV